MSCKLSSVASFFLVLLLQLISVSAQQTTESFKDALDSYNKNEGPSLTSLQGMSQSQRYTTVGPTCWENTCYTGSTAQACLKLGGTNIGDRFCILNGQYTVVGPTCNGNTCYTGSTAQACLNLGGTNIGDVFCVLEGDNWEVVGPTCWGDTCYTGSTAQACLELGGTNIGDVFCILKEGSDSGGDNDNSASASVHIKYIAHLMFMASALLFSL